MTMADNPQPAKAGSPRQELLDLLPALAPLPWEDRTQHDALKAAVIAELNPSNPHQQAVAQRIFESHWDQYRSRLLLQDVSLSAYRKVAIDLLSKDIFSLVPNPEDVALAERLTSPDHAVRAEALGELADRGLSEDDIRARAYLDHMRAIETLERRTTRQDDQRRALLKEFQELKATARLDRVPEAEELPTHDN